MKGKCLLDVLWGWWLTVNLHGDILADRIHQSSSLRPALDAYSVEVPRGGSNQQLINHHGGALLHGCVAGAD